MDDYRELKPEDLVEDPAFRAWVYHGTGDAAWNLWLREHPDREQVAQLARNILLSVRGEPDPLPDTEVKSRVRHIVSSLDPEEPDFQPLHKLSASPGRIFWWRAAAAALVIAATSGLLFYPRPEANLSESRPVPGDFSDNLAQSYMEVTNDSESQKLVNLPDGSSVLLMKASGIRFPKLFSAEKREVYLSGEAFFEVQKMPGHPFFVYAGEMVTRVVGTSFTIKAYDTDETVIVRVKTGKVSVSPRDMTPGKASEAPAVEKEIILNPNQEAVLSRSDLKIALLDESQRNVSSVLPIEQQTFEFRRTSVAEVLEIIKAAYKVDIRYDAALLESCTITASLGDEPLTEKLNMLCEVIGASYRMDIETIVINAPGCE